MRLLRIFLTVDNVKLKHLHIRANQIGYFDFILPDTCFITRKKLTDFERIPEWLLYAMKTPTLIIIEDLSKTTLALQKALHVFLNERKFLDIDMPENLFIISID